MASERDTRPPTPTWVKLFGLAGLVVLVVLVVVVAAYILGGSPAEHGPGRHGPSAGGAGAAASAVHEHIEHLPVTGDAATGCHA